MPASEGIWDSHIHILPPGRTGGLIRWIKRSFPGHPTPEDITPEQILADLAACGVETVFNLVFPLREEETSSLNLWSAGVGREYANVIPFGSLHIETPRKDEVAERCINELGLAGIKLHPYAQRFEAFSTDFEPLFRKLDELGRPLIVHTGFDVFYRRTQDLDYLRGVLERYPGMPVVLVHSLFPRFRLAYEMMIGFPHLYLDMTNVMSAVRWYLESPPGTWPPEMGGVDIDDNLEHFRELLGSFSQRIMFGTDHPAGMGSPRQIYEDFKHFELGRAIEADLLGGTARRFLDRYCGGAP